ncbi:MAG: MFS transporter [Rhodospirillales bacterium]|nr:MFS transporter [Rhodospirillales bacterium]
MTSKAIFFYLSSFIAFICGHSVNYSVIMYSQDVLGSDLLSGIGFGLCFGPPIILGWYAGVLCDRLAPGRLIIYSQLTFALCALVLWVADQWVDLLGMKAAVVNFGAFLAGCGWSFIAPARFAALGQIISQESLHGATVVLNLLTMLGFGIAPILIAITYSNVGWSGVFLTLGAGFIFATVLVLFVPTFGNSKVRKHAYEEVKEGLRAVAAKPILLQLLLASVLAYTLMGPMQVLLPRLASSQLMLSDLERGSYLGILAIALIIGGVLCMILKRWLHDGMTILLGAIAAGVAVITLSQINLPMASGVVLLLAGTVGGLIVSLIVAGLQAEAAPEVRGRVMSMYTITSQIVPAASGLGAGVLSQYLGVVWGLLICGGFIVTVALLSLGKLGVVRAYNRV